MLSLSTVRVIATAVVLAVFLGAAAISIIEWGQPTYWFPGFVAIAGTIAAAASLTRDLLLLRKGRSPLDDEVTDLGASVSDASDRPHPEGAPAPASVRRRVLAWTGWFVALPLMALVIPFFYASLVWLVLVLRLAAHRKWLSIAISVIVFGVALNVLVVLLNVHMPPALLTGWG